jgi:hypothetical protein
VKILDFGISKFDPGKTGGMALTQEGAALGTPYYMSPEQIRGEIKLDARTDVYALGVILYECAAGVRPFEAEALTQLAVLIHLGKPRPLAELRPDLPPGFSDLVGRAMATDPAQRVQSARDLRAELERFGAVSFKGQARLGPTPSILPAAASVAARSLATSAAGVSVRAATTGAPTKSQTGPIAAGFAILALAGAGAAFFLRSGGAESRDPAVVKSATPAAAGAPSEARHAEAVATAAQSAAVPPLVPSASSRPASVATPSPTVVPTLPPQAPLNPPPPVVVGGPGAGPEKKVGRSEKTGLEKKNPFK